MVGDCGGCCVGVCVYCYCWYDYEVLGYYCWMGCLGCCCVVGVFCFGGFVCCFDFWWYVGVCDYWRGLIGCMMFG